MSRWRRQLCKRHNAWWRAKGWISLGNRTYLVPPYHEEDVRHTVQPVGRYLMSTWTWKVYP